jgi:hypothetical protein
MQRLRRSKWFVLAVLGLSNVAAKDFRPPAVPLIANSPYFSVWSMADHLTDDVTRHWTGTPQSLGGLVRIDGKPYRVIGNEPRRIPAMEQRKVQVLPTRTIYEFEAGGVGVTLTFMTPALPSDLDVMSRPGTYVTWTVQSNDGKEHSVSLYFDASSQLAVDTGAQEVVASRLWFGGATALRVGSEQRPILRKAGDFIRIDWGYLYVVAAPSSDTDQVITSRRAARNGFAETGSIPSDDLETPKPAGVWDGPALAYRFDLGKIGSTPVSRYLLLAYDEVFSVQYLDRWLRPLLAAKKRHCCGSARRVHARLRGDHGSVPAIRRGGHGRPRAGGPEKTMRGWRRWRTGSLSRLKVWQRTITARRSCFRKRIQAADAYPLPT